MKNLILFLAVCAFAQGQGYKETIEVRLLAISNAANMPERFLSTKEGYEEIAFSNRQASQITKAYTAVSLPLFKKATDPSARSEFSIAEQVKLPQDSKSALLLCWNTPEEGMRYYAINDSILDADYNNWLMINTTPKAVGIRIGENTKPVFLEPNSIKKHQITAEKGKGVPVVGRAEVNGAIKTFYSTYWRIKKNERSILIFNEVGSKIKVTRIGDRLLEKKAAAP